MVGIKPSAAGDQVEAEPMLAPLHYRYGFSCRKCD